MQKSSVGRHAVSQKGVPAGVDFHFEQLFDYDANVVDTPYRKLEGSDPQTLLVLSRFDPFFSEHVYFQKITNT